MPSKANARALRGLLLATGLLLGVADDASASELEAKRSRDPLSTREVERSLILAKGWIEIATAWDHHLGTGAWGADGSPQPFENARWTSATPKLKLTLGLSAHAEFRYSLDFRYLHLVNDALDTNTADFGLGDMRLGWSVEVLRTYAPTTSVVLEFDYKAPTGKEAPGSYLGGPYNVTGFVLTTGTPDLRGGVAAKRELGPLALTGRAGFTWRFSHVVQYAIELNRNQFLGRIRPGAKVDASVEALVQAGPMALSLTPEFTWRAATRLGTTSPGITADANLDPVTGSDGWSLDLRARAQATLGRGVDLIPYAVIPLRGEDLQFFPLEDIHPTMGPTFGGVLEVRY